MPSVLGTKGNLVTYEILGVGEVISNLTRMGKMISTEVEIAMVRSASRMQEEVKESIAGLRTETKSVDTGAFINSINIDKLSDKEFSIGTDIEYAKYLEFGTKFIVERMHFQNTLERNRDVVIKEIQQAVNKSIK